MKILAINCSPRKKQANSYKYINILKKYLDCDYYQINNKNFYFNNFNEYEHIILVLPLYADSLPSQLLIFLETNKNELKNKNISIIINCGFFEYKHNSVAFDILNKIAKEYNFKIKNTFQIATGEAILTTPFKFFIYFKTYLFANSIKKNKSKNFKTRMFLTKKLFILGSNNYWHKLAQKNKCPKELLNKMDFE